MIAAAATASAGVAEEGRYPSDVSAAWSPTGREIAFVRSLRSDLSRIYVVRPDGSGLRLVHSSSGEATGPVWSPDGRSLAFTEILRTPAGEWKSSVRIATMRSRPVSRPIAGYSPDWSPDGRRLVLVRNEGRELAILGVPTRRVRRLPLDPRPARFGSPDWAPDGRRLVFTVGGNSVWVASATGRSMRFIGRGRSPSWSPDGRVIAADCLYSGRAVFLAPERENPLCTDHAIHVSAHGPHWSPDGSRVALSACFDPGGDCGVSLQERGVERPRRIAAPGVYPSWAPGGRRLVFSSARWNSRLLVVNSDGTGLRPLLTKG